RPALRVFAGGAVALTVDRAAGRGEDDPGSVGAGGLEHLDRPEHVRGRVVGRPLDRDAHVDLGRKVEAGFGALEGPAERLALFAAARAQLVEQVIAPGVARGADVVCDRYLDSSLAYQGIARGLGVERVLELNVHAIRGILPDRTFLLLLDPEESGRRLREPG